MMRKISQATVDLWGIEDQMLMVAEEAIELAHAVHKWRRAWKRYNKRGISITREQTAEEQLEDKAYERTLEKKIKEVQTEAMQTLFMVDQLQVMLPGKYEDVLEEVLEDAINHIKQRGGKI